MRPLAPGPTGTRRSYSWTKTRVHVPNPLPALAAAVALACGGDGPHPGAAIRDTLPNGALRIRYPALPLGEVRDAAPDLRLGTVDDDPQLAFGDVRGVDAGADGTIYVLDYQASEIRAFDRDGRYVRTVASRGEGPAELSEANGFLLVGDSILWIQDHGKWAMIGVTPAGDEVTRLPMHVRSYGYIWNGTVDDRGRFWKPQSHSVGEPSFPPELGLNEGGSRSYLVWHDPAAGVTDSLYLGERTWRTHVSRNARGGWSYRGIPHDPEWIDVVDPGGGFWQAHTAAYRIARLDASGDTTLVIESDLAPIPVTADDHRAYVDGVAERSPDDRPAAEEVAALMPDLREVIEGMFVDDEGRVWVRRVVTEGAPAELDVFDREGTYLSSVRLGFEPAPYAPLRIRNGDIYTWVLDALDVPFIVRAPVPDLTRPLDSEL